MKPAGVGGRGAGPSATRPAVVGPRELNRLLTRDLLVDAARDLFRVRGFKSTSVAEIAAAAGTSRATFYLHFTDKAEVATAIQDEIWEAALAFFLRLGALKDWTLASIREWIDVDADGWDAKRLSVEGLAGAYALDQPDEMNSRVVDMATRLVDAGGHWATWPTSEAWLRATVVIDVLSHYNWRWQSHGFALDRDSDLNLLAWTVLGVLTAPAADSVASDSPLGPAAASSFVIQRDATHDTSRQHGESGIPRAH